MGKGLAGYRQSPTPAQGHRESLSVRETIPSDALQLRRQDQEWHLCQSLRHSRHAAKVITYQREHLPRSSPGSVFAYTAVVSVLILSH